MTAEFIMNNKIAMKHLPTTLVEAENLMHFARTGEHSAVHDLSWITKRSQLARTILELDSALDMHLAERITKAGGEGEER
jgi:hypothetical protein